MMKVKVRKKVLKKNRLYIRKWKLILVTPLNITPFFKKFQRRKMKVTRNTPRSITFIRLNIHNPHHLIKVRNLLIYSRMLINQLGS